MLEEICITAVVVLLPKVWKAQFASGNQHHCASVRSGSTPPCVGVG